MYKVVKSRILSELESIISDHLAKGYLLAGGLQAIYHKGTYFGHNEQTAVDFTDPSNYQCVTFAQAIYLPQTKEHSCLT